MNSCPKLTILLLLATLVCSQAFVAEAQNVPPAEPNTTSPQIEAPSAQPGPEEKPAQQAKKDEQEKVESQRVLGIMPQFSVTSDKDAKPLKSSEKFHLFFKTAFDPYQFGLAGLQAGIDQAEDEFPAYGQGIGGFGKRYAADFGDQLSAGFFSNFFWPSLLKEDPRYFRLGEGPLKHRLFYALAQEFVCHTDSGGRSFNFSNVLGAFSSGALSNTYHPQDDRGVGLTARSASLALVYGSGGGLLNEFWPDINRKLHKKKKVQTSLLETSDEQLRP